MWNPLPKRAHILVPLSRGHTSSDSPPGGARHWQRDTGVNALGRTSLSYVSDIGRGVGSFSVPTFPSTTTAASISRSASPVFREPTGKTSSTTFIATTFFIRIVRIFTLILETHGTNGTPEGFSELCP